MMRAVFGILGLVIVVAIIGMLAKKQMQSIPAPVVPGAVQGQSGQPVTPKQQIDQFKQGLDATLQQPRGEPAEEKK